MNYATITIDGKPVGLKFGLPSYRMFTEKLKVFPQIFQADGESMIEAGYAYILYFGYINNCMIKDVSPAIPFEKFMEYVESVEENQDIANEVSTAFSIWGQSKEVQKLKEYVENESKKKNGNLTNSKLSVTDASASV